MIQQLAGLAYVAMVVSRLVALTVLRARGDSRPSGPRRTRSHRPAAASPLRSPASRKAAPSGRVSREVSAPVSRTTATTAARASATSSSEQDPAGHVLAGLGGHRRGGEVGQPQAFVPTTGEGGALICAWRGLRGRAASRRRAGVAGTGTASSWRVSVPPGAPPPQPSRPWFSWSARPGAYCSTSGGRLPEPRRSWPSEYLHGSIVPLRR